MPELRIRDLSKTCANGVHTLQRIHRTLPPGMYGLLGPNGAGKSTLIRTIATFQEPEVLRQKDEVRRTLRHLPQELGVHSKTSAEAAAQ